jgi:hypothetical protein
MFCRVKQSLCSLLLGGMLAFGPTIHDAFRQQAQYRPAAVRMRVESITDVPQYKSPINVRINQREIVIRNQLPPQRAAPVPPERKYFATHTPILMYHRIGDQENRFTVSPKRLWQHLDYLRQNEYMLATFAEYASAAIKHKAAVLTFDDSTADQFRLLEDGRIDPDSAVGILERYKKTHPGYRVTATFFVNTTTQNGLTVFEQAGLEQQKLSYLAQHGYEIGSHGSTHSSFRSLNQRQIQENLQTFSRNMKQYLPSYQFRSFAYPYGSLPDKERQELVERNYIYTAHAWSGIAKHQRVNAPRIEIGPASLLASYAPPHRGGNVYKGEPNLMLYARSHSQLQAQHPQAEHESDDRDRGRRHIAREGTAVRRQDSHLLYRQEGYQGRSAIAARQQGGASGPLRDGYAGAGYRPAGQDRVSAESFLSAEPYIFRRKEF